MKKAIIAMSGGVDSSVAAYLMKNKGFECIGATMKLFDNDDININNEKSCCSLDGVEDARSVANKLGIPYYVFNFKADFNEKVIKNFIQTYENGGTPNPCIECNRNLKFKKLMDKMKELEFDYVVTGHYASVEEKDGRFLLKRGADSNKDQSYVLYSLTQEQLSHIIFPLGDYNKSKIREIAEQQGFLNAHKKESQDICFVPDGDYVSFIKGYTNKEYPKGNFIDIEKNVIGQHQGIINYTVGQRKGLGVAFGEPRYVCSVNPENNTVTLGKNEDLFSTELIAKDINLISVDKINGEMRVKAKVRYKHTEQPATVIQLDEDTIKVVFDEPQRAITKGQAVVLYDGDYVVGGGTII
ncbi:MAG: tRNA 2-thiouridine(34) synthase MnmA [Ruminococcaceae bacterium]|nr:tRNA 2-thiouridine(34) synthase MnmA [Oscillospiraceae bacterium]